MSPARAAVVAGMLLLAVLLQTAVLARLPVPGPVPDLVLLVVIGAALTTGANAAAVTGFAAGILVALVPPSVAPVGLAAILYSLVGYYVGSRAAGERLARGESAAIAAGAGALVAAATLAVAALWGDGWPGAIAAAVLVGIQAAYCGVLGLFVPPAVGNAVAVAPGRAWE